MKGREENQKIESKGRIKKNKRKRKKRNQTLAGKPNSSIGI